jgi:peptide/nickel transport system substrate-binding protein
LAALVLGAGAFAIAYGEGSATATPSSIARSASSSTLIVDNAVAVATLDPTFTNADQDAGFAGAMYSELTQVAQVPGPLPGTTQQNLDVQAVKPFLAKSWKITNGGATYTFFLRPGLKFPSGDPVDAAAVAWSLNRTITAGNGGYSVFEETQFKPALIKSIKATGPLTVVIQYSRPAPNQLQVLSTPTAGAIYDPKLVEAHGGQKANTPNQWLASHSAGYGPYLLQNYQAGHQMVLVANPNFFEPPKAKKIIVNFIANDSTLLLNARSGAADITLGLSPEGEHSLVGNSCCNVAGFGSRQAETLNFPENKKNPWFNNQTFRQALAYAVPFQAILQRVAFGYGKLYNGEWMPAFTWFNPKIGAVLPYNVAKAKQLIAASKIKTPVSFPIYVAEGDTVGKEIATAVSGSWQQIGVNASVQVVSPSDLINLVYVTHAGPTLFLDGPQVVAPDYYWAYDLQCPPNNAFNDTDVCVPAADKIMKQIEVTTNPTVKRKLDDQADQLYVTAQPRIWVYNQQLVAVLNKDVTSYFSSDLPDMRFWAKK